MFPQPCNMSLPCQQTVSTSDDALSITNTGGGKGLNIISSGNQNPAVRGENTAIEGTADGVQGFAQSPFASGVFGNNNATDGYANGVFGASTSSEGRGVDGLASHPTGHTYGVRGQSNSTNGRGVFGLATATSGPADGVTGESASIEGVGVHGVNLSVGDELQGGVGVFGEGWMTGVVGKGRKVGVVGETTYPNGNGVEGKGFWGVMGQTTNANGVGLVARSFEGRNENPGLRVDGRATVSGEMEVGAFWPTQNAGSASIRLGADTENNDIEIGSSNQNITDIAFWNSGGSFFMNTIAELVFNRGTPTRSDARLKTNVAPLANVLEKLEQIRGVSFEWNDVHQSVFHSAGSREIGVIAQEVERVFPELTTTWGTEGYKAVDYGRLTAVVLEAVKELKIEIDRLRSKVEDFEQLT